MCEGEGKELAALDANTHILPALDVAIRRRPHRARDFLPSRHRKRM